MVQFKSLITLVFAATFLFLGVVHTAQATKSYTPYAKVVKLYTTSDGKYGECLVKVNAVAVNTAMNCGNNQNAKWFHLSCNGVAGNSAASGRQNYSTALAAYLAGKQISLEVDDAKKADGYCYAYSLEIGD